MSLIDEIVRSKRKEKRIALALPVKVYKDEGRTLWEWSCTYEISRWGARLKKVRGIAVGQEIWIQRQGLRAKYRVIWIGNPHAGQFGAQCLENKIIWDEDIQGRLLKEPAPASKV